MMRYRQAVFTLSLIYSVSLLLVSFPVIEMFRFGRGMGKWTTKVVAASTLMYQATPNIEKDHRPFAFSNVVARCDAGESSPATPSKPNFTAPTTSSPYAPSSDDYERVNEQMYINDFNVSLSNHVLYSCLLDDNRIKRYEVYKHKHHEEILCIVDFGEAVVGWPEIVHGGISALLIDNTFGWLLFAYHKPMSVTANLHLDYRSPVRSNSTSILRVKIDHAEGRKLHMTGSLIEASSGRVQVEAKSLFIIAGKKTKQEGY